MNGSVSPRLSMPKAHGETCSPGTRLHFSSCASELQRTAASRWFWKGHCTKKNCFSDSRCNETVSVAASCFRSTRAPSLLGNCGVSSSRRFAADPSWGLLSAAPMMDYTNRHWRHLISLMSRRVTLYTEMVSVPPAPCESSECSQDLPPSIKRKLWEEISSLSTVPNHVVLQVGVGSVASAIAVARAFNSHEFSENRGQCEQGTGTGRQRTFSVNLNCGCPSPRVAKGSFGLILMEDPKRVAEICQVLLDGANSRESQQGRNVADEATGMCAGGDTMNRMAKTDEVLRMDNSAVSVKCRVGIEEDRRFLRSGSNLFSATTFSSSSTCTYEKLASFIATVTEASPVRHFIIHARPGILVGKLSPKENLQIPQRRPEWVYRLCQDFPNVSFTFNGGVKSFHEAEGHLLNTNDKLGGVMVGRDILDRPWYWGSCADAFIAAQDERRSRQCTSSIEDGSEGNRAGPPQDQRRGSVAGRQTVEASVPGEDMKKNVSLKKGRQNEGVSRAEVVEQYACYVEEVEKTQGPGSTAHQQKVGSDRARKHTTDGGRIILSRRASLLKPLLNLFAGEPGSRAFKQRLQAACDSRNSHLAVESRSSVCTRPERERGETQAGEYTRQIVSTKASRIRFPRPEPTGEIIRRALEVFPSDVLEHRQSGET
ncbi:conserved hypothetical protein [Neospora caninum Liverpool]|uniref:tRNA-dihydrouridine synthase A n=1 Tax=Neospora caninum (strain Liverpool) TaxID=572307 RepID=F0VIX9_NEOCL|nr:conserved hypothetical protein [Neospora caninum Liverpool]CBZ53690.1 conserved hypothetical protein [Neospora caninum Liverpool]CEL67681.1 TPA: tRNA-dihydrouridine synthase A [Neospora caninum Liverpool]|eukprot:XP_003883722.1 conserved hypothetical protein [Neospora caninum Liverpool]